MKKIAVAALLAFAGLTGTVTAHAQMDEQDRRYCASGRSGMDFNSCMRQMQNNRARERDRYDRRDDDRRGGYDRRDDDRRSPQWQQQQPPPGRGYSQPIDRSRLSDMQQRALDNCAMLQPRDQPRCRATVMSTVR
ncbi:MAG: hypothetical protein Q7T55_19965 [Solirubrobacteraceae bacterium]|nr:hypothetical protein [Solirubrobacteraceae bacterium]